MTLATASPKHSPARGVSTLNVETVKAPLRAASVFPSEDGVRHRWMEHLTVGQQFKRRGTCPCVSGHPKEHANNETGSSCIKLTEMVGIFRVLGNSKTIIFTSVVQDDETCINLRQYDKGLAASTRDASGPQWCEMQCDEMPTDSLKLHNASTRPLGQTD